MTQKKKRKHIWAAVLAVVLIAAVGASGVWAAARMLPALRGRKLAGTQVPEWVDVQLISVDGHSRLGEMLDWVRDIVIQYVGNPGTTAQQNRNW